MKMLLAILGILVSMQGAQATPAHMQTALDFENESKLMGGTSHKLSVYMNGEVTHTTSVARPNGVQTERVAFLTSIQMERIFRLIRRSTPVIRGYEVSGARCFAPSNHTLRYTAMNDTIFLREGEICAGGFTVNVQPAAKRLVHILDVLEQAAHNRMAYAEVERQVSDILN